MMFTPYTLPTALINLIEPVLKRRWGLSFADSKSIADCILQQSNYYIQNPDGQTPWDQDWCQIAQLVYYMPLNFLRTQAILDRINPIWPGPLDTICDIGCGLSPISLLLNILYPNKFKFILHDRSDIPFEILTALTLTYNRSSIKELNQVSHNPTQLTVYSYSLTENLPLNLQPKIAQNIFILEPATRQDGRKLMELRASLLKSSFNILAPCTHPKPCPLLEHSKTDWCHDRIFFSPPDWWTKIESYLPFKNQTLTFSYLVASRSLSHSFAPLTGRIIGDTLFEKGKTKQAICYQDERSFLTWPLKTFANPPLIERGRIFSIPAAHELKGDIRNREIKLK